MRNMKFGLSEWKVDKAYPGYTVFAPLIMTDKQLDGKDCSYVYMIDMKGDIVHHWEFPGRVRMHGEILENGNLLCSFTELGRKDPHGLAFSSSSIVELDWDSNIVWRHDDPMHDCHDRCRLRNGNTLYLRYVPLTPEEQKKVKGGLPGTEPGGVMYTFEMVEITPEGKEVDVLRLADILDPEIDVLIPYGTRELWPGLNSIEELSDGRIMSTSYNLSGIFIWNRKERKVDWRYGSIPGEPYGKIGNLSYPHDPTELENGNILVFDNGRYHVSNPDGSIAFWPPDSSRVVEIDPKTNEEVWEYRSQNPVDFYSTYISSAQRLPNGNTLIDEGATGRFFEVTPQKEIVWEYVSPFFSETGNRFGRTNAVFRIQRYPAEYPGFKGKKFDKEKEQLFNQLYGFEAMEAANKM